MEIQAPILPEHNNYPEFIDLLKYSNEIRDLIDNGVKFNNNLEQLETDVEAFRFAHDHENINNHKPVYIINPQRRIRPTEELTCSGYALSCFDTVQNAETSFNVYRKSVRRFHKAVGNAIVSGDLTPDDGLIGPTNLKGHFDLYEYIACDLGRKFTISKILV